MSKRTWSLLALATLMAVACDDMVQLEFEEDAAQEKLLRTDADGDGFTIEKGDCDDTLASVYPGADDVPYDGIDQDCSGSDLTDVDGDGVDAEEAGGTDCDDTRWDVRPDGVDLCGDGVDQDCSGSDEDCGGEDLDDDGYAGVDGDCNDANPDVNPGETETPYNGVDDDCDISTLDDDLDEDGARQEGGGDCDDDDDSIYPGATEIAYDGIDQDCSGADLTDVDRDGFDKGTDEGEDCDDSRVDVSPSGVDLCGDGIDQDCSGADLDCNDADVDGDGHTTADGDCNDHNPLVNPDADETPYNGLDDDCDAVTKDDDLDGDGYTKRGYGDCNDTDAGIHPGADEIAYDGIDQDCSGRDLRDRDGDGFDPISEGGLDCDDLNYAISPSVPEIPYDGIDQNCDGSDFVRPDATLVADRAVDVGSDDVLVYADWSTDRYLVAWPWEDDNDASKEGVWGQFVGVDGRLIGENFLIYKYNNQWGSECDWVDVAAGDGKFLVSFECGDVLQARFVSEDGDTDTDTIAFYDLDDADTEDEEAKAIWGTFKGNPAFGIVTSIEHLPKGDDDEELHFFPMAPDGTLGDKIVLATGGDYDDIDIATDGNGTFMVIAEDRNDALVALIVDTDVTVWDAHDGDDDVDISNEPCLEVDAPSIAFDGNNFQLAWSCENEVDSEEDAFGMLVSPTGVELTGLVPMAGGNKTDQEEPEVEFANGRMVYVFNDEALLTGTVGSVFVGPDGMPENFPVPWMAIGDDLENPTLATNGTDLLVIALSDDGDIYAFSQLVPDKI